MNDGVTDQAPKPKDPHPMLMILTRITTTDGIFTDALVLAIVSTTRVVVADDELGGFSRCELTAKGWRFADRYTDLAVAAEAVGWTADEPEHNPAWQVQP